MRCKSLALVATLAVFPFITRADDSAPAMPPMPKPGPEHAWIAKSDGIWEITGKGWFAPGEPMTWSGTSTAKMTLGGFWQMSDFDSEMMGAPFHGHQLFGYDQVRKKYVSVWADSSGSWMMVSEGQYDAAKKTLTMTSRSPDMDGKLYDWKEITVFTDDDHFLFTMFRRNPRTKAWARMMELTYTRRK